MDVGFWILNLAYVVYVASAMFKDMLRLRLVLLLSTIGYIAYGFVAELWPLVWWNIPFGIAQSYHIFLLLKQRIGVNLNEEAEAIRVLMFSELERPEFNVFWQSGHQSIYRSDETIIEYGQVVDDLMLILEGQADVYRPGHEDDDPIRLGRLRLLGEMSTVSGGTARATVKANGIVRTRNWDRTQLEKLGKNNPAIEKHALLVIGNELTRKLG